MKDEKWIKEIAQPILDQLKQLEEKYGSHDFFALPQVRFVVDKSHDGPLKVGDVELSDEIIAEIEDYIREKIEEDHKPTILH